METNLVDLELELNMETMASLIQASIDSGKDVNTLIVEALEYFVENEKIEKDSSK